MDKCIQHAVDVVEGRKGNILFRTMLESKNDNLVDYQILMNLKRNIYLWRKNERHMSYYSV